MPVVEYANMQVSHPDSSALNIKGIGTAVTGVRMYRGAAIPLLQGKLVVADWSASFKQASGQLFIAMPQTQNDKLWPMEKITQIESRIISLAEDRSGQAESLEQAAAMHATYAGRQLEPQPGA